MCLLLAVYMFGSAAGTRLSLLGKKLRAIAVNTIDRISGQFWVVKNRGSIMRKGYHSIYIY